MSCEWADSIGRGRAIDQDDQESPRRQARRFFSDVILATPRKTITAKGVIQQSTSNRFVSTTSSLVSPGWSGRRIGNGEAVKALMEKRVKASCSRPARAARSWAFFGRSREKVNPYLPLSTRLHDIWTSKSAGISSATSSKWPLGLHARSHLERLVRHSDEHRTPRQRRCACSSRALVSARRPSSQAT